MEFKVYMQSLGWLKCVVVEGNTLVHLASTLQRVFSTHSLQLFDHLL